jgi:hypothetical protein
MKLKHAFAVTLVAASIGAAVISLAYGASVDISIGTPPPPCLAGKNCTQGSG